MDPQTLMEPNSSGFFHFQCGIANSISRHLSQTQVPKHPGRGESPQRDTSIFLPKSRCVSFLFCSPLIYSPLLPAHLPIMVTDSRSFFVRVKMVFVLSVHSHPVLSVCPSSPCVVCPSPPCVVCPSSFCAICPSSPCAVCLSIHPHPVLLSVHPHPVCKKQKVQEPLMSR